MVNGGVAIIPNVGNPAPTSSGIGWKRCLFLGNQTLIRLWTHTTRFTNENTTTNLTAIIHSGSADKH